jgi:hypothetical protein
MASLLRSDLRFQSPDDIYQAVLSLADGLSDEVARSALAGFALLLANHIGDDKIVYEAVTAVKQAFTEHPEALAVGTGGTQSKDYQIGGALASLRKIIEVKPAPTLPGALTS